jgi:hypothetical protein
MMDRRRTPWPRPGLWLWLWSAAALAAALVAGAALLFAAQVPGTRSALPAPSLPAPSASPSAGAPSAGAPSAVHGAGLLWSAVPGTAGGTAQFASVQCVSRTFTSTGDAAMGAVWKVVQPPHQERCEVRGPTVTPGSAYYLGWSSKFDITDGMSRYIFQVKCDPSTGTANHPVVLDVVDGRIELQEWRPDHTSVVLWSTAAVNDRWSTYALGISEGRTDGTIRFWYDGVPQTLAGGSQTYTGTTYDGTVSYLKWGLYHPSAGTATQWLGAIRMGTTLSAVTG